MNTTMTKYLNEQRARPATLSQRTNPVISNNDQLIEVAFDGKVYGLNLNHVQRNLDGELLVSEVVNTFKTQLPEIVDRYFDRRVLSSPEFGGQRWTKTSEIAKFLRRETTSKFVETRTTQQAIEVAAKRRDEAEHQEIKVFLTPSKVGAGLSTGMRSAKAVDYAVTPSELLKMMQEALERPTTVAMKSAIESARFTLIAHISQRDKVWLKNGIEQDDIDEFEENE
ncbi:hypothetical protein I6M49_04360 [Shewanella algae]|uniref:hypothetical protein n=1 Tax=Shewanella algae TaxID=38313 RepID=UPI001AACA79D|nr:hypothetical protein [Shewanella algae]MBO2652706.1 hypothetical protein [Shewanella algae]